MGAEPQVCQQDMLHTMGVPCMVDVVCHPGGLCRLFRLCVIPISRNADIIGVHAVGGGEPTACAGCCAHVPPADVAVASEGLRG